MTAAGQAPPPRVAKEVLIIAGPNGAGKTTFALTFLRVEAMGLAFVNADEIAAGLDPLGDRLSDVQAARLMLDRIDGLVSAGQSFAIETTLAGRGYLRRIVQWRDEGYRVLLVFLSLASPGIAIERVQRRVRQGGHFVPEDVVRRRFDAGVDNLWHLYTPIVDGWAVLDNTRRIPDIIEAGGDLEQR
jgi:predicted ABC-type ATPase